MISEFDQLSAKVSELAALAQSLRRENADLRQTSATLVSANAELSRRMQQAHDRVAALLANIPAGEQDEDPA